MEQSFLSNEDLEPVWGHHPEFQLPSGIAMEYYGMVVSSMTSDLRNLFQNHGENGYIIGINSKNGNIH